ncbi:MAG: hypothetical protein KME46_26415 [Brasilonema angustatum HA4187-MV1]|nr:hypothetical protein [Brasilonema angustatum HA4187-MV1]
MSASRVLVGEGCPVLSWFHPTLQHARAAAELAEMAEDSVVDSLKAGGAQTLAQFLNHPAVSFVIAALDDWHNTHQDR